MKINRRRFLRGVSLATGAVLRVGLPPLEAMFNPNGTAYAADAGTGGPIESRFLLWFNGNGILERYWIPSETGRDFELTPCLSPLRSLRNDIHVISGIDNPAARVSGPGNTHHKSMSALMSGMPYTGRGAGGISIDQVFAAKLGLKSRYRSLQVGVAQESHGENIHRNMSWGAADRALPPEMIPHDLFDRLFSVKDEGWVGRKKSVLDAVQQDVAELQPALGKSDRRRLDEHLTSVRDLERAIASLPPDYGKISRSPRTLPNSPTIRASPRFSRTWWCMRSPRGRHASRLTCLLSSRAWLAFHGWATRRCATTITLTLTRGHRPRSALCATSAAGTWRSSRTCCRR